VVFGEHSNITNLEVEAFASCSALTSITLTEKLEVIEMFAFNTCYSLERVVFNKNLKTIGNCAFDGCSKLKNVQLASKSISFGRNPFRGCDRLIELAAAAGFPSNKMGTYWETDEPVNMGEGVVPYLIDRFERSERKRFVLVAHMRFKHAIHDFVGSEEDKFNAVRSEVGKRNADKSFNVGFLLQCCVIGGGAEGILGSILQYV